MVPFIICFSGFPEVFYDRFVVLGTQLVAYVPDMVIEALEKKYGYDLKSIGFMSELHNLAEAG